MYVNISVYFSRLMLRSLTCPSIAPTNISIYIDIYTYIYVYIYICIYKQAYIYIYIYIRICIYCTGLLSALACEWAMSHIQMRHVSHIAVTYQMLAHYTLADRARILEDLRFVSVPEIEPERMALMYAMGAEHAEVLHVSAKASALFALLDTQHAGRLCLCLWVRVCVWGVVVEGGRGCVFGCVCVCVCTRVCVCTCVCGRVGGCMYVCACVCAFVHVGMFVCLRFGVWVCLGAESSALLAPRFVAKRPIRLKLDDAMEWHSRCNRLSSSPDLSCHVLLQRDQLDWNWMMRLNDTWDARDDTGSCLRSSRVEWASFIGLFPYKYVSFDTSHMSKRLRWEAIRDLVSAAPVFLAVGRVCFFSCYMCLFFRLLCLPCGMGFFYRALSIQIRLFWHISHVSSDISHLTSHFSCVSCAVCHVSCLCLVSHVARLSRAYRLSCVSHVSGSSTIFKKCNETYAPS